jgi:hypothetical protein
MVPRSPVNRFKLAHTCTVPDDWAEDATRRAKAELINSTVPNAARIADYLNGGQDNFEADRRAARALAGTAPAIATVPLAVRAFQQRVLRFLVTEAGITQFLDIGTGLPLVGNTHEVTQSIVPECRVVYVDNDPMVLSHARALMTPAPGGVIGFVDADVRDPASIVPGARETLDLSEPVAILLLFTLAYVEDAAEAAAVVSSLAAAVPSGSHVAIYHLASDLDESLEEAGRQWNKLLPAQPITLRSCREVAGLVAGLDLVPPGVVNITDWRPAPGDPRFERTVPVHAVVARKPLTAAESERWPSGWRGYERVHRQGDRLPRGAAAWAHRDGRRGRAAARGTHVVPVQPRSRCDRGGRHADEPDKEGTGRAAHREGEHRRRRRASAVAAAHDRDPRDRGGGLVGRQGVRGQLRGHDRAHHADAHRRVRD